MRRLPVSGLIVFAASLVVVLWQFQRVLSPEPIVVVGLALAWAALFAVACLGAGRWAGRLAGEELHPVVVTLSGAGTLALFAGLLGLLGQLRPLLLIGALLSSAALGVAPLRRLLHRLAAPPKATYVPLVLATLAAAVALVGATVVSSFYDQHNYHLAMPEHWMRLGRLVAFERHDYSFLPSTASLLYCYALAWLPPWAAQVQHWLFALLAAAATSTLARHLAGDRAAAWSMAIILGTPAVLLTATWAASDLAATAFAAAAWLGVLVPPARARPGYWLLCGALTGWAVGAKALTLATAAVPLGIVVVIRGADGGLAARAYRAVTFVVGGAITFGLWPLRAALAVGAPLHPFLGGSKVAGFTSVGNVAPFSADVVAWLVERAAALTLGTFSPQGAAGVIGPLYLLLLPAAVVLLAGGDRIARWTLVGFGAGVAMWSLLPHLGRYLLAPLVLGAALAGAGLSRLLDDCAPPLRRLIVATISLVWIWTALAALSSDLFSRLAVAAGLTTADEWSERSIEYRTAVRFLDEHAHRDDVLLLVAESRSTYFARDVVVEDPFQRPLLVELATAAAGAEEMRGALAQQRVRWVLYNRKEAERIAAMNRRETYFAPLDAGGAARVRDFFLSCLEPRFEDGPVVVYRMRERCL